MAVRRRVFEKEKWETPYRRKVDGVSHKRLSEGGGKRGTEKISRYARNDSVGDGYPVHHTKNVWEKHVSRIVIGSGAEGSFSLAVRRRASDSRKRETPPRGKAGAVLPVNGLAKKSGKKGTKKISLCARNDSVGDGYPVHHTKNVWGKHVSRIVIGSGAEGSFSLAVRRRVFDGEKWETPYHGKWKRRVSRIVIPSEVEGSFSLAVRRRASDGEKWETPYREKVVCHGNKKRGGIPLFLYFDGSPSSSLSSPTVSAIASAPWAASSSRLP